jgi:predicted MFS family arabinose efflux permease
VVAALGAGFVGFNALPFVVGALVDGVGLDAARAGLIASLEIGGMAASALLLAPRVSQWSLRSLALLGACGAAAAHGASALVGDFAGLAALRLVAGGFEGAVVAAGNALIAGSVDPDRLAARVEVLAGLAAAALLLILPWVVRLGAQRGAFGCMALVALVCLPLIARIPHAPASAAPGEARALRSRGALAILGCGFLLAAGEGAIWAFVERIGVRAGVAQASIGLLLGSSTLVGLLGAGLAAALGTRWGRRAPLLAGIGVQALACWGVAHAARPETYVASVLGYALSFFFVQPYLVGTAAVFDPHGRVAAAYAGAALLGGGAGPALGGLWVGWASYPALGWQLAAASLAAIGLIHPVAASLDRRR